MRDRIAAVFLIVAVLSMATLRADQPATGDKADKPDSAAVQKLIQNLGNASFSERDQASKKLETMGPDVLTIVRQAKSTDPEVNARLNRLVDKLEEQALTASILTPRLVHLKVKDVTVLEAVSELRKISGLQIDPTGDMTGLARKITLDTGNVSVWQALQQLCEKGGMAEQAPAPVRNQQMNVYAYPRQQQPLTSGRGIVLVDGAKPLPPTCFNGAIRIRALPVSQAANKNSLPNPYAIPLPNDPFAPYFVNPLPIPNTGELSLMLEVVAEQRLEKIGIVDALFFDKIIDNHGQKLELIPEKAPEPDPNFDPNLNGIVMINGMVQGPTPAKPEWQRTMTFRFKPGTKSATSLKELSGKLILQTLSPFEPLVSIKEVRKAAGQTVKGKDGHAITVESVENLEKNGLRLKLTLESPADGSMTQNPFGANVMVVVNVNGNMVMPGNSNAPIIYPKLVDANGKKYEPIVSRSQPVFNNNGQMLRQATLTYRPEAEANLLLLEGQRNILFQLPINLKDIPVQ
jgi:hypothetical protein